MDVNILFLGLIQGMTEFLPVSSSGHLFLAERFLGLEPDLNLAIMTHLATLLAVMVYFHKRLQALLCGILSFVWLEKGDLAEGVLALKLIVATLCTVVVALLIEPYFENFLNLESVGWMLLLTAVLIGLAEFMHHKKSRDFTWALAVVIGLVQALAVVPGLSRAGLTIGVLIMLGLNRQKSAEISFLLAIPTIFGAGIFAIMDEGLWLSWDLLGAGIIAFVAALLTIGWMMRLVEKRWVWFIAYCAILGGSLIVSALFF